MGERQRGGTPGDREEGRNWGREREEELEEMKRENWEVGEEVNSEGGRRGRGVRNTSGNLQ